MAAPLSVVVPTLNAGRRLPSTLASLGETNETGLLREVVVSDGGSSDDTVAIAEEAGCRVVVGAAGRGGQLARGAEAARGTWLLFLHADTALERGWSAEAALAMAGGGASAFRHAFRARGWRPGLVSAGANLRARAFRLPYGDQGLLVSRADYERAGGFEDVALFEDVGLVRRLRRVGVPISVLRSRAMTGAERYERQGYARRVLRNQCLVLSYLRGTPPARLAERYG